MEKQTKDLLTKETMIKGFLKENNRFLWISAFSEMFALGLAFLFVLAFPSDGHGLLLYCVIGLIPLALLVVCSIFLVFACLERNKIKNGKFVVAVDQVRCKEEKIVWHAGTAVAHKSLRFCQYGEVPVDHTCFQMTSEGDFFYLVVFPWKNPSVREFYDAKVYEYRE